MGHIILGVGRIGAVDPRQHLQRIGISWSDFQRLFDQLDLFREIDIFARLQFTELNAG